MSNSALMHRFDDLGGLELLVADFSDHQFDVHWHDTWSIGVVLRGANNNSAKGGADGIVRRGQISIIAPGQVHAGSVVGENGCNYFMFYPKNESVLGAAESMEINLPVAEGKCIEQTAFAGKLCEAAAILTNAHADSFEREVVWSHCVAELINVFSPFATQDLGVNGRISPCLIHAKEYLHDHNTQEVRLDKLAHAVGMSKYHLCRQFSEKFGLSPSRYQRQLRLQQAKRMLSTDWEIAEIAAACGFADQSHLGRAFKSTYGITPRNYRNLRI
ncbi:AraC family transcriptional regulator [Photorhabdus khanii subsp. guanajuatensis]|uniref:Arabinose operon regulatory protein n=2 Tax=Photorhabdus khanii TaxID=1004150 RepID=A0A4R4K4J9_9GAMM|nr:AraC family transcriptional regulator [Photorhabdus khanii subsp. guanajuatensis]